MILTLVFLVAWWLLLLSPFTLRGFWSRITYYLAMTSLLLYSGIATMGVYYDIWYPLCKVREESMVHIGPDTSYVIADAVHTDDTVRVIDSCGTWRKIKNEALTGWVRADCLAK